MAFAALTALSVPGLPALSLKKRQLRVVAQLPSYGIPNYGNPSYGNPNYGNPSFGNPPPETIPNPSFGDISRADFQYRYGAPTNYSTPLNYQTPRSYAAPKAYGPEFGKQQEELDSGGGGGSGGVGDDDGRGGSGDGDGDGDGYNDEAGKKLAGLSLSQKLTLAYAVLIGLGGMMGFVKTGSGTSLLAGGGSALILYYVFSNLPTKPILSSIIGLGISGLLLFVMGYRFSDTGKVFPAGVVSLYSLVMTGGYLHGIIRGH